MSAVTEEAQARRREYQLRRAEKRRFRDLLGRLVGIRKIADPDRYPHLEPSITQLSRHLAEAEQWLEEINFILEFDGGNR